MINLPKIFDGLDFRNNQVDDCGFIGGDRGWFGG
jgi:hypothetical protein